MASEEIAALAAEIGDHVQTILFKANVKSGKILFDPDAYMSDERIFEVASYLLRDLGRIEHDQKGKVSITKYVAYLGFWFSKLKPINGVYTTSEEGAQSEICDINERVALVLMDRVFWSIVYADKDSSPSVWADCEKAGGREKCSIALGNKSIKGLCYKLKNRNFLTDHEKRYQNYIVYGLRHRSISPYFLVNYLDEGIFYSCENSCPPLN